MCVRACGLGVSCVYSVKIAEIMKACQVVLCTRALALKHAKAIIERFYSLVSFTVFTLCVCV